MLVEQYRRWFEYEQKVHQLTLDSLRGVPADQVGTDEWHRATTLFGHLIVTRLVWLYRLGASIEEPANYFPEGLGLEELEELAKKANVAWATYLGRLSDADLARIYDYRRPDGRAYRNSVENTLAHLFGHSFYHRGQIAMLVRMMGGQPAATDLIFSFREEVE